MTKIRMAAALLSLSLACYVSAQSQGTIVGTVTDQGGAVVPAAHVTLINEGTGFARSTVTNANGQYVAESFPAGKVTVSVEHPGSQWRKGFFSLKPKLQDPAQFTAQYCF